MSKTLTDYNAQKDKLVYGAAYDWVIGEVGGPIRIIDSTVTVLAAGSFAIAGNPDRVALIIVNLNTSSLVVAFSNIGATGNGIQLVGVGAVLSATLRDDYVLASLPIWLQVSGGGSAYVVEYSRVRN
jgi:hypothetical protein